MSSSTQPSRIRILVAAHKPSVFPDCASILPIQVGCSVAEQNGFPRFEDTLHDDDGDNISALNPMYSELTAQYWAWKNMDADYYGFAQYRRHFDFTSTPHTEDEHGEIPATFIDDQSIAEYGLDDGTIAQAVEGWDLVTVEPTDVRRLEGFLNLKEQWDADRHLRIRDLRHMYDLLCMRHPDYREDADAVLNGNTVLLNNMFIMKKPLFHAYCEWLFPLLEEFISDWDHTHADVETLRTPGHLAERLLTIFVAHLKRVGIETGTETGDGTTATPRIKQLRCVRFSHPEPFLPLEPLDSNPRFIVPVIFAADDDYVPVLTTAVTSMLVNASKDRHYDVIVLERNITAENRQSIVSFLSQFPNATIRFYDVSRAVAGYHLISHDHRIGAEMFYRFVIQDALPFYTKVLYLDCDLVINGDVAELYDTDLRTATIGAVPDLDFLGNLNTKGSSTAEYARNQLRMQNPFHYFQTGVLVMDLERMRELHTVAEWLEIAQRPGFLHNDQDILNMECEGDVAYLPYEWNVLHNCGDRMHGIFDYAPAADYLGYLKSREAPKIVHYAGPDKPWTNPWCDFGPMFWQYARTTPFSLQMMAMLADVDKPRPAEFHERTVAEDSPVRKYVDKVAPLGSKQREVIKIVARRVQGKR